MKHVKILFELEQDEDGYPPVAVESLWAIDRGDGRYELDNIPFYVTVATAGDVVAVEDRSGQLAFAGVIQHSSNSLIRILCADEIDPQAVRADLKALGCESEYDGVLIALSLPATVPAAPVWEYLDTREEAGAIEFEVPIHWVPDDDVP